jgi:hypothetical protein
VARAEHAEVVVVNGRELGFVEALDDGEDGGVYEADGTVSILVDELARAGIVSIFEIYDGKNASENPIQECNGRRGTKVTCHPPLQLDKHRSGKHPQLATILDQASAWLMSWIVAINCRNQDPGVEDYRQLEGSLSRSEADRATSARPEWPLAPDLGSGC